MKQPVVLMKWYRVVLWMLDRVDHFPKNQRFVFGQRLAERSIHVRGIPAGERGERGGRGPD